MKQACYRFITGESDGAFYTFLRRLLTPLRWFYASLIWVRNRLYDCGLFRVRYLPCKIISVGNIVVGGTGKTPAVITIAKALQKDGVRIAILLRGYQRRSREKVTLISDGEKRYCSLTMSGDEAGMIAQHLNGVPIIVGKNRYLAGKFALARFQSEVLILDDGFQHRQLYRDVDIITVDTTQTERTKQLLPTGILREPLSALHRADIVLLTRTDAPKVSPTLKAELKQLIPNTPILETVHRPVKLYRLTSDGTAPVDLPFNWLRGKPILAVCGIGNPNGFAITLEHYAPASVELIAFPDHHVYSKIDCERLKQKLKQNRCALIVTTQKDEQKLARFAEELPIVVIAIALTITGEDEGFGKLIRQRLAFSRC